MTLALIATLLLGALTEEYPSATAFRVADYFNILFLLVAVISLKKDVSWFKVLLFIIGCMAVMSLVKRRTDVPGIDIAYMLFLLGFYIAAIRLVGREVLLTGSVDLNKVIGSIALYFMLGLFFSALFTLLLHFSPEALRGLEVTRPLDQLSSTVYFSFVTLTTLGYGDITPVTPLARFLVILESVTGMFYLALIVASLVGSLKRSD